MSLYYRAQARRRAAKKKGMKRAARRNSGTRVRRQRRAFAPPRPAVTEADRMVRWNLALKVAEEDGYLTDWLKLEIWRRIFQGIKDRCWWKNLALRISTRAWNRLMHALNGNRNFITDWWHKKHARKHRSRHATHAHAVVVTQQESVKSFGSLAASTYRSAVADLNDVPEPPMMPGIGQKRASLAEVAPPVVGPPRRAGPSKHKRKKDRQRAAAERWPELEKAIEEGDLTRLTLDFLEGWTPIARQEDENSVLGAIDVAKRWAVAIDADIADAFKSGQQPSDDGAPALLRTAARFPAQLRREALCFAGAVAKLSELPGASELAGSDLGVLVGKRKISRQTLEAANELLILFDRANRVKPAKNHGDARDSTQADIETNPGPGRFTRAIVAKAVEKAANAIGFQISDDWKLNFSLEPVDSKRDEESAYEYPGMAKILPTFPLLPPGVTVLDDGMRAMSRRGRCRGREGHPDHRDAVVDSSVDFAAPVAGQWRHQALPYLAVRLCPDTLYRGRLLANMIAPVVSPGVPIRDLLRLLDRAVGRFRCTNEAHTTAAILEWHRDLPSFMRGESGLDPKLTGKWQGYSHYQCPLCWPEGNNVNPLVSYDMAQTGEQRAAYAQLVWRWTDLFQPAVSALPPLFVIVTEAAHEPDLEKFSGHATIVLVTNGPQLPPWGAGDRHVALDKFEFVFVDGLLRFAPVFALGHRRWGVVHDYNLFKIPATLFNVADGGFYAVLPDGNESVAMVVDPATDVAAAAGGLHIAIRYAFAAQLLAVWMDSLHRRQVLIQGPPGVDLASVEVDVRLLTMARVRGTLLDATTRVVAGYDGPGFYSFPAAVHLLRRMTVAPPREVGTIARLLLARWRPDHAGQEAFVRVEDLPHFFESYPVCGCLQCLMRVRYGDITIGLGGTRGDRLPFIALGRVMRNWGLNVRFLELLPVAEGEAYLKEIQRGRFLKGAPGYIKRVARLGFVSGVTIGPFEMFPDIIWTIAPPTSVRRSHNFLMGPVLNSVLGWFAHEFSRTPRVAAYKGVLNLPRSPDGENFLPYPVPNGPRTDRVLYAMGSSGYPVPAGADVVQPGDHVAQFSRVKTVVCHGGAGTVQTAAACGARVISVDNVLDRNYLEPLDAGRHVWAGADPNKVMLMLLGVDMAMLFVAFRGGFRLGLDAIRWYVSMYLFQDFMAVMLLLSMANGAGFVPGDAGMVVGGVFLSSFLPGAIAWGLSWISMALATAFSAYIRIAPSDILMTYLRTARRVAEAPTLTMAWALLGPKWGLLLSAAYSRFAAVGMVARVASQYDGFLAVYWVYGLPIHTVLENEDCTVQYEGSKVTGLTHPVYMFRRVERDSRTRAFRIRVAFNVSSLNFRDGAPAAYHPLTHNCHVVLLEALGDAPFALGFGGLIVASSYVVAAFLGGAGLALLAIGVLLLIVFTMVMGGDLDRLSVIVRWAVSRERELMTLERHLPSTSIMGMAVRAANILMSVGALDREDQEFLEQVNQLTADFTAYATAATDEMRLVAAEALVSARPFVERHVPALGALIAILAKSRSDVDVAADIETVGSNAGYRVVSAVRDILRFLGDGEDVHVPQTEYIRITVGGYEALFDYLPGLREFADAYDNWDPEIEDNLNAVMSVMPDLTFIWSDMIDIMRATDWGNADVPDVDDEGDVLSPLAKKIAAHFLFRHEVPAPERVDGMEGNLAPLEIDHLGAVTAFGLANGLDPVTAVTNAVLDSREGIQGDEPLVHEADRMAVASVQAYWERTRAVRSAIDTVAFGVWRVREWIRKDLHANVILAPLDALMNFIGILLFYLVYGIVRIIGFLVSLCVFMPNARKRFHDTIASLVFFIQVLDPRHRTSPKSVWALLWKRRRANVTKTEQMIFSLANATYERPASYADWVDQMARYLETSDVNVDLLPRDPPSRALFYPRDPVGVREYEEIDALADVRFTETPAARKFMDESLAAGNPLTIDAAWLATPDVTAASLARYTVPRPAVDYEARMLLTLSARALFDQYKHLYDRPMPMTARAVAHLSKWKYAAGLPFMPFIRKREALRHSAWFDAIITAAERILATGKFPAVGLHGFAKNFIADLGKIAENPLKARTVTAGDRITATAVNTLLMERNKRAPKLTDGLLNMMRRTEGGILALEPYLRQHPSMYSGDGRAFDSTVAKEVATVGSVELFRLGFKNFGVYNTKAAVSVVHAYYEALTEGLIVDLNSGATIWKTGGGGTGSAATTPDNRDWTRLVFVAAFAKETGLPPKDFFKHFFFTNASDDIFFSVSAEMEPRLSGMLTAMYEMYGVDFSIQKEEGPNNILRLVAVPDEEVDARLYELVGVPKPKTSLRHDRQRLLFTRSAFRADRMRLNPIVAAAHIADRSTGYQLLTAHSPDLYDLVTRDLTDALLSVARPVFGDSAQAVLELSETGLVVDAGIRLPPKDAPVVITPTVRRAGHKAIHRGYKGTLEDYARERQTQARRFINQRKGMSYRDVFHAWVRTPPSVEEGKVARRWQAYRRATVAIGPVADLVRLGVLRAYAFVERIPKSLLSTTAEAPVIPLNMPFNTWDYTIEMYIWRREFLRSKNPPSYARMASLIRESPYAAATDIGAFMAVLGRPGVLDAMVLTASGMPPGQAWRQVTGTGPDQSVVVGLVATIGAGKTTYLSSLTRKIEDGFQVWYTSKHTRVMSPDEEEHDGSHEAVQRLTSRAIGYAKRQPGKTVILASHFSHFRVDVAYCGLIVPSMASVGRGTKAGIRGQAVNSRAAALIACPPSVKVFTTNSGADDNPAGNIVQVFNEVVDRPGNRFDAWVAPSEFISEGIWMLSNDALMGRVLALMAWYTIIDFVIRALERRIIIGIFVIAAFGAYRALEAFYSFQSLLFWTCTGYASLAISNTIPKDRYVLQKQLAAILAAATPRFLTDYCYGIYDSIGWLAEYVELQTLVPNLVNSTNTLVASAIYTQPDSTWDAFVARYRPVGGYLVVGGTGTGKSTSLIAGLLAEHRGKKFVLAMPTNRLVDNYESRHYDPDLVVKVRRGDPAVNFQSAHRVYVMTYGQAAERLVSAPTDLLIICDEAHTFGSEAYRVWSICHTRGMAMLLMTATPAGAACDYLFGLHAVHFQPATRRATRLPDISVATFPEAYQAVIDNGYSLNDTAWYHPAVNTLTLWAASLSRAGANPQLITANHEALSTRGCKLFNGVVLAGANLSPAPSALIASPVKVERHFPDFEENDVRRFTLDDLLFAGEMRLQPLSRLEVTQLAGRVARERTGRVFWIGEVVDRDHQIGVDLASFTLVDPDTQDLIRKQWAPTGLPLHPRKLIGDVFTFLTPPGGEMLSVRQQVGMTVAIALSLTSDFALIDRMLAQPRLPTDTEEGELRLAVSRLMGDSGTPPAVGVPFVVAIRAYLEEIGVNYGGRIRRKFIPVLTARKLAWAIITDL